MPVEQQNASTVRLVQRARTPMALFLLLFFSALTTFYARAQGCGPNPNARGVTPACGGNSGGGGGGGGGISSNSGTFAYTGNVQHDRGYEPATLLPSGQVLVAGGQNSDAGTVSSAELYTPSSGTYAYTGNLQHDRAQHTATYIPSINKVLITAGWNGDHESINSAELYDPSTGAFSYTGNLNQARAFHTATLITAGPLANYVLIAGGLAGTTTVNSAELYNPYTGTFTYTGTLVQGRSGHTATLLSDGRTVLIAGGASGTTTLANAELYDSTAGSFAATGSLVYSTNTATAVLLPSGQVLISGGQEAFGGRYSAIASNQLYNPTSGTFSLSGSLVNSRFAHIATLLTNGKVLIAGGSNGSTLFSAELYDPSTGSCTGTGSLQHDRAYFPAVQLQNGQILVTAGVNNDGDTIHSAELYTP